MTPVQILCVVAALTGFAANSLLTRAGIGGGFLDAPSFALIRIVSGAVVLSLLISGRRSPPQANDVGLGRRSSPQASEGGPSWLAALALAGYLAAFTVAYTRIGAAIGALLLFGAVQVTMVTVGLVRGERPARIDWLGAAFAVGGLLVLTLPGVAAPNVVGALLMMSAGACWGAYSLLGRDSAAPLADTAVNFVRTSLLCAIPFGLLAWPPHGSVKGAVLATVSGTLASGLGYTFWYAALPALSAWRAAILQLIVPILTAVGAWLILGERITPRLAAAGALVALGVWFTSSPRWHSTR
jgi:drug/metabolite transporter (DMT)-like permease